jgi:hypothetical protein
MRQRQPDCAKLQQAGRARVENSAGDVNVRNGVAVEEQAVVLEIIGERYKRDACGQLGGERGFTIPITSGLRFRRLGFHPLDLVRRGSFQMGQFTKDLEAGIDFFAGEGLQALGAKTLDGKRAHHAAIEESPF